MPKNTKSRTTVARSKESLFAFLRFLSTMLVLLVLSLADLVVINGEVPTVVYLMIGALNGVDAYKLYRELNK